MAAPRLSRRHQALPDLLHILHQHWVVDVVWIAVQLTGETVAQPPLGACGHVAAVAQGGQLGVGRHGQARQQPQGAEQRTGHGGGTGAKQHGGFPEKCFPV